MYCSYCGSEISELASFCSKCGGKTQTGEAELFGGEANPPAVQEAGIPPQAVPETVEVPVGIRGVSNILIFFGALAIIGGFALPSMGGAGLSTTCVLGGGIPLVIGIGLRMLRVWAYYATLVYSGLNIVVVFLQMEFWNKVGQASIPSAPWVPAVALIFFPVLVVIYLFANKIDFFEAALQKDYWNSVRLPR
jgi:hypothetical protein